MFWIISALVLLAAGLLTAWPLLASGAHRRLGTWAAIVAAPLLTYWLYLGVGTPQALHLVDTPVSNGVTDMDELTATLRARLSESPDDLDGWLLLGRSYKSLQRYPEALTAIETANRLVPNEPVVIVELVEARLFASGNPRITEEMTRLLEQAVDADPSLQKGLWLLGIAASQRGDEVAAVEWWQRLLQQVEPGSAVADAVNAQIVQLQQRSAAADSAAAAAPAEPVTAALLLDLRIEASAEAQKALQTTPNQAVLFVIIRAAAITAGPPLGVRRIDRPGFPLDLSLTDADSMLPQRPISLAGALSLQARLSLTGSPTASSGDWQSSVISIDSSATQALQLLIDQPVD